MLRKVYVILLFSFTFIQAQSKNSSLAKIGDDEISVKEFKIRYELSPFINTTLNADSVKYHFLISLIAEKLFAVEAKNLGLAQTEKFNFVFKPIEKMYVRDALFNKEIKSKIKIDEQDILKGINKYNTKLKVEIFSSRDSVQIYKIFNELDSRVPMDSLSNVDERDSAEISFGDIKDEVLEDTLFSIFIGEFTKPTKTEDGWFLFYLKDKISNIASADGKNILSKVNKIITGRRTEKAYYKYMKEVFKDKIIEADKDLFLLLSENTYNILKQNASEILSSSSKFYLNESDFEKIKTELGNKTLNEFFFTVDDKPITLNDFLADLLLKDFQLNR